MDLLLQDKYPALSRNRIKAEIMAGNVLVNGTVNDKPGSLIDPVANVVLQKPDNPYVSRGGLKLAAALNDLSITVKDYLVLDVGASTGGFTDCLLKNEAGHVYALDVGYGQLDYKLRQDDRVTVLERFNIRDLDVTYLDAVPDFAVVDVSFISLKKVIPVLAKININEVLALVKPQFEVGRVDADKGKGVIRDPYLHQKVLFNTAYYSSDSGYCTRSLTYSRYPGPKGNIEYFIHLKKTHFEECVCTGDINILIKKVVDKAQKELNP
ncbi:MAG: TlyA family RNA methyltransferase [Bacillota bacterium]